MTVGSKSADTCSVLLHLRMYFIQKHFCKISNDNIWWRHLVYISCPSHTCDFEFLLIIVVFVWYLFKQMGDISLNTPLTDSSDIEANILLTILQITDTAYPTGGFSHSLGYESADKHSLIKDRESYTDFLYCTVENAGSLNLPFVREGHANYDSVDELKKLSKLREASLSNHVANRASIRQGCSMLDAASQICPSNDIIEAIHNEVMSQNMLGHQSIIHGAVCAALGISQESTLIMFMYSVLKTVVSASVKLGKVGTMEGQRIQHQVKDIIPAIINRNRSLAVSDVHVRFPVVDICQNVHDTMFSKLFYS